MMHYERKENLERVYELTSAGQTIKWYILNRFAISNNAIGLTPLTCRILIKTINKTTSTCVKALKPYSKFKHISKTKVKDWKHLPSILLGYNGPKAIWQSNALNKSKERKTSIELLIVNLILTWFCYIDFNTRYILANWNYTTTFLSATLSSMYKKNRFIIKIRTFPRYQKLKLLNEFSFRNLVFKTLD